MGDKKSPSFLELYVETYKSRFLIRRLYTLLRSEEVSFRRVIKCQYGFIY